MLLDRVAEVIRLAREDVGMTQTELARAADMQQPSVSAYESGRKQPRSESFERIARALRMRPSIPLAVYADAIRDAAGKYHLSNVRVFGSAVRGTDDEHSDIDLLIGTDDLTSLFDIGGFAADVESITGFPVDVLTDEQVVGALDHVVSGSVRL